MREDEFRNRTGRGPEKLAAVRRTTRDVIRLMDDKWFIRRRILQVPQMPDCRLELIRNAAKLAEAP